MQDWDCFLTQLIHVGMLRDAVLVADKSLIHHFCNVFLSLLLLVSAVGPFVIDHWQIFDPKQNQCPAASAQACDWTREKGMGGATKTKTFDRKYEFNLHACHSTHCTSILALSSFYVWRPMRKYFLIPSYFTQVCVLQVILLIEWPSCAALYVCDLGTRYNLKKFFVPQIRSPDSACLCFPFCQYWVYLIAEYSLAKYITATSPESKNIQQRRPSPWEAW